MIDKKNSDKPLVSIITPCYNGEKFIHKFLDSVLNQTYRNIELIFINDGSFDKTEEIALSYQERFKLKGIKFKYISQENKGQAAALNQGLKIFTGDYITWPDSDDMLHKDSIKDRINFLEKNRKFNIVLSESMLINDVFDDLGVFRRIPPANNDNLFYDLIIERNVYFAGGAYMIRSSEFIKVNLNRHIYESRGGQNWQMLLPVLYKNECGYLNKKLYYIYVRPGSHSRQEEDCKVLLSRHKEHEDILQNTIKSMNIPKKEKIKYLELIKKKYIKKNMLTAFKFKKTEVFLRNYAILKQYGWAKTQDYLLYLIIQNKFIYCLACYFYKAMIAPIKMVKRYFK
jgi:glycosyltransferase involved in cell wall biosynthesis